MSADWSEQAENFLPNLSSVVGDYAMRSAFYGYKPRAGNETLNLSNLAVLSGKEAARYMCQYSGFKHIIIGVQNINSNMHDYQHVFSNCLSLSCVEFPNLSGISSPNQGYALESMCNNCPNIVSTLFPALKNIFSGYHTFKTAWYNCPKIKYIEFPELTAINSAGGGFSDAIGVDNSHSANGSLVEMHFPKLTALGWSGNNGYSPFNTMCSQANATRRHTFKLYFDSMVSFKGGSSASYATFYKNRGLIDIYLPSLTGFTTSYVFNSCSELTGIHFGAANQAAIESSAGYATLWGRGAGAATVYYDL